ncbi:MAG TPA: hypothetical protein VG652_11245 [Gaiellaceae bacterium]|nr:hypothetical protein [Gaiellaceae bacterium]
MFVSNASAQLPNPCALVTNAEVAKSVGDKIQSRTAGDPHSCTWNGVPYGTFMTTTPTLTLDVSQVTEAQFRRNAFSIVPGAEPGTMEREAGVLVKHVGTVAYSLVSGQELIVWYRGIMLDVSSSALVSPLETAKALAKIALTRLPR